MKHPLWIIEHARMCRHSSLAPTSEAKIDAIHKQPQYTCNLTDPRFTNPGSAKEGARGQLCRLYNVQECPVREPCLEDGSH